MSSTFSNAGPGPREPEPFEIAEELHMQDRQLPQWAYAVDRDPEHTRLDGPTRLSWGTCVKKPDETAADFAARVGGQTRGMHTTYTGPLHVQVWTCGQDEHYRKPVPHDAARFTFEPGTPPIPEPEPCTHGHLDYCRVCDE